MINLVAILMMSTKLTATGLLENRYFEISYDLIISFYDVPAKFHHMTQIILYMWSRGQSFVL